MKILSADTSSMMGSVALIDGDTTIAESLLNISTSYSERLLLALDQLLNHTGLRLEDMDGLAIAIGPGSFTGLRIGLATFKGLAIATGKKLVGISSLLSLAYNAYASGSVVVPIIDAKRGEIYAAAYKFKEASVAKKKCDVVTLLDEASLTPEALCDNLLALNDNILLLGDGANAYRDIWINRLGKRLIMPPASMIHPRASNVATLAIERFEKNDVPDLASLIPNYIRKSDAEKNEDRRNECCPCKS